MTPTRTLIATALLGLTLVAAGCSDSADALLAKAKESLAKKEAKAAEIHLKNLLQKEDRAEARYLLGQVHASNGDYPSAEKEFEKAVEGGFDKFQAGLALAEALISSGNIAKGLEQAKKLSATKPADVARLQTLIGRASLAMGKADDADAAFKAAVAAVPDDVPAQIGLITLVAAKDIKAAAAQIDGLLAKAPNSPDALSLKGDILLAQGNTKEAMDLFAKVASAEPGNRQVRAKLGSLASELKDYAGAQKWIDELKKLTGPAPGTMHLQALNDFRQGKNEAARDAVLIGLKQAPNYLPSLALASTIYLSLNALEQAEANARTVVEKAPNSTLGYRLLGTIYLRMNAPDRALQVVQPLFDRGAKDPVLYGIAGEAALKLNEADRAATFFNKATELAPNDLNQKTGRGMARIAAGDKEGGLADLEAAAEQNTSGTQADLALVSQHLRDKQWDKAMAAIDRLEKKIPNNPLTNNLRGTVSIGKGDVAAARKFLEAALAQDPNFFAAASNLAALDLREKKPEEAKKRYTRLLDKDPKNVRAMLTLAQLSQATGGDKKEALEWLKKAREADKSSVPAVLALARFHLSNNEAKEVLPALQEAATASPENVELLDALGTVYLRAGDDAQAVATFEKILRLKPDSGPLHLRMGEFYAGRKDYERALSYYRKSAELAPKAVEPRVGIASALMASGKTADARAMVATIQKDFPKSIAGAALDGEILTIEKKYPEAIAAYRKALAIQPSLPVSLKLHRTLLLAGRDADAGTLLKSLLADNPNDIGVMSYAAMLEIGNKRWPQVIALYQKVVAAQPNNAVALNNLAWAMYETKDPAALTTAERAYSLAPKASPVLDTLAAIVLAKGDTGRAVDLMKSAVAIDPKVMGYRNRLAEALIAKGDKSGARKELDVVLAEVKTGPVLEQAQALMKKL